MGKISHTLMVPKSARIVAAPTTANTLRSESSADPIEARDLPPEARVAPSEIANRALDLPTLSAFKEFAEREFLVAKLRENGWNISRTAEVIQTPRSNLYKKIEHHKISRNGDA